ncbi:MAG TPA: lysylphosphatidylglycerol synthase transmembrane domain-containing protein [Candidatus Nitrosotenuis sp.]|nr:lysylphosphatidylglycerol synthase transmembrane domain-containing protein [Candidatus Nitrosotenuis sp.]
MKGAPVTRLALGLLVSGLFLYLAVRNLSWADFWASLRSVEPGRVGLAALLMVGAYALRAVRWRLFFRREEAPGWWTSQGVVLLGFAANNLLPARSGELVRAHCMARLIGSSPARVLAMIVLERAFDALSLVVLTLVALPAASRTFPGMGSLGWLGVAVVVVLAMLFWLWRTSGAGGDLRLFGAERLLGQFREGLHSLGRPPALAGIAALSLAVWSADVLWWWCAMSAFPARRLPWDAALAACVFGNVGTLIPSGPGAVGTLEAAIVLVLGLWGFEPGQAFAMALLVHVLQFVYTTSTGWISWMALWARG